MSCYTPKRKTASGVEEVSFPINSIEGLSEELATLEPTMPMIRVGSVADIDGTMMISATLAIASRIVRTISMSITSLRFLGGTRFLRCKPDICTRKKREFQTAQLL